MDDQSTWNREQLYSEVWKEPLVKVAVRYGVSNVMVGKVCRKLQIPLPGRGYWAKKEFGKAGEAPPLPEARDLPQIRRLERPAEPAPSESKPPEPEPTDPQYQRIREVEKRTIVVNPDAKRHKLVSQSAKALAHARTDRHGRLEPPWDPPCLDIHVSKESTGRALMIANTVILALEADGFEVAETSGKFGTTAKIFGYGIPFSIVERYKQTGRREVRHTPTWTSTEFEYKPSGELEFRVGHDMWGGWKWRDGRKQRLEDNLSTIVAAFLRDGRERGLRAEREKHEAVERQIRERERWKLREQIEEEEKKVCQLEKWVSNWGKAREMREFVAALEAVWTKQGHDLSGASPKGQRIKWMKEQADRLDPMIAERPASILDRKNEV